MSCSRHHPLRLLARRCPTAFVPTLSPLPSYFLLPPRGTMGRGAPPSTTSAVLCIGKPPLFPFLPQTEIRSSFPSPKPDPLLPSGSIWTRRTNATSNRRWRRHLVRNGEAAVVCDAAAGATADQPIGQVAVASCSCGDDDDERKNIRMMKNRESPLLSRARKRVYVQELEKEVRRLVAGNIRLKRQCIQIAQDGDGCTDLAYSQELPEKKLIHSVLASYMRAAIGLELYEKEQARISVLPCFVEMIPSV